MTNLETSSLPISYVDEDMSSRIRIYKSLLHDFSSRQSTFRILSSVPQLSPTQASPIPKTLHILDSSFNPPTLAHFRIALDSLTCPSNLSRPDSGPRRLVLLLATQNADKAPKPAAFEERLAMMQIFASEILQKLQELQGQGKFSTERGDVGVDIAVTKYPYFVDKASDLSIEKSYTSGESVSEQVHLIGYDTATRLLSPKYYPPEHTLQSLVPFLERHRLEVTYRTDDNWGGKEDQDNFLSNMGEGRLRIVDGMATAPADGEQGVEGSLEGVGGKKEWVTEGRLVMVGDSQDGEEIISSTKVREAVKNKDEESLKKLVTPGVGKFILDNRLYESS
ncbi:cytidylyltransferase [Amylocarpus encephaloides]|uniref:Cytidylyltransferase n=1 Tax=Amylocarpus encephaloides TaxID=45428 RepID=A0A9P7YUR8_9HELO|nr:cytidylyltransferase [Amylocarpus encephaloides]